MAANIGFNPVLTTVASGTFSITTDGFVQGVMMDDPVARYALAGGYLAGTETLPMWGGIAIYEDISGASGTPQNLGSIVGRAASNSAIAGFSVFNQASNMVTSPQSEAPSAGNYMTVNFLRLGSGARIAVQADPELVALQGGATTQQVSWDFNNQRLQPYDASTSTITITSASWASTGGGQLTANVSNWTGAWQPVAGDVLNISGATNSGTGGAAAINTNFTAISATSTSVLLSAPAASGVFGTIGGSPVFNYGTGALNVKVLNVQVGQSRVISYDAVNNYVHWANGGTCALILI